MNTVLARKKEMAKKLFVEGKDHKAVRDALREEFGTSLHNSEFFAIYRDVTGKPKWTGGGKKSKPKAKRTNGAAKPAQLVPIEVPQQSVSLSHPLRLSLQAAVSAMCRDGIEAIHLHKSGRCRVYELVGSDVELTL